MRCVTLTLMLAVPPRLILGFPPGFPSNQLSNPAPPTSLPTPNIPPNPNIPPTLASLHPRCLPAPPNTTTRCNTAMTVINTIAPLGKRLSGPSSTSCALASLRLTNGEIASP
mmetsp:Transcript_17923/g.37276  ORF Transcript_17923/g.37276 Transcript_17923/m.37276 type:complete len:112 (-) Transcript_17923:711-1046(-)